MPHYSPSRPIRMLMYSLLSSWTPYLSRWPSSRAPYSRPPHPHQSPCCVTQHGPHLVTLTFDEFYPRSNYRIRNVWPGWRTMISSKGHSDDDLSNLLVYVISLFLVLFCFNLNWRLHLRFIAETTTHLSLRSPSYSIMWTYSFILPEI